MKNYEIIFLEESSNDLNSIFNYILLDSPQNAQIMLDKIFKSIENLEIFPLSGNLLIHNYLNYFQFRMIVVNPYIVFYRFIDNKVYIYRILHGASDYIKILSK